MSAAASRMLGTGDYFDEVAMIGGGPRPAIANAVPTFREIPSERGSSQRLPSFDSCERLEPRERPVVGGCKGDDAGAESLTQPEVGELEIQEPGHRVPRVIERDASCGPRSPSSGVRTPSGDRARCFRSGTWGGLLRKGRAARLLPRLTLQSADQRTPLG